MSSLGSWWCHACNKTFGRPRRASGPVCPRCDGGFVEKVENVNHAVERSVESMDGAWGLDMTLDRIVPSWAWVLDRIVPSFRPWLRGLDMARATALGIMAPETMARAMALATMAPGTMSFMAQDMATLLSDQDFIYFSSPPEDRVHDVPMVRRLLRRDISGTSLNSSSSHPEDLVHEDELLSPRRRRENRLKRKLQSVELLQVSVESDPGRRGPPPASRASVDSLVEVDVGGQNVAAQPAMCKGEFKRGKYARRMCCCHMYDDDCILQPLAQHNSCSACRYKKSTDDPEYDRMPSCGRNDTSSSGMMGISRARFGSHRPPHVHVRDDEFLLVDRRRMMRNMGECSLCPGLPPASRALVNSLLEVEVRGKDVAAQCEMCKGEFEIGKYAKRMPCSHMYHADCILQWLAQHNSCPACGYKMKTDDPEYGRMHSRGRNETSFSGGRSRFSHIRPFRASMKTFQQAQAETCSGSAGSGKTVSSFFHDTQGNNFGLDHDGDVIMQDAMELCNVPREFCAL